MSVNECLCNCAILIETSCTTHVSYFIVAVYLLLNISLAVRCIKCYTEYRDHSGTRNIITALKIYSNPRSTGISFHNERKGVDSRL